MQYRCIMSHSQSDLPHHTQSQSQSQSQSPASHAPQHPDVLPPECKPTTPPPNSPPADLEPDTNLQPTYDIEEHISSESDVRKYLRRVFPRTVTPHARKKVAKMLWMTACGARWREIERDVPITWVEWRSVAARARGEAHRLYAACRGCGRVYRQILREDEAHDRAVHGVKEPIYYKGQVVGHVRHPSDKLMELMLRAGDPDRYADRVKTEQTSKSVSFHFHFDRTAARKDLDDWRRKQAENAG